MDGGTGRLEGIVEGSFCPAWSCSHSVTNKHTETYINYKLFSIIAQACY